MSVRAIEHDAQNNRVVCDLHMYAKEEHEKRKTN